MSTVVDSVQQIVAECNSMLEHAKQCEFCDITGLATTLQGDVAALSQLYELSPEDVNEIRRQKLKVERLAITLEFYMYVRLKLYGERKQLRDFAGRLYSDCRAVMASMSKKEDVTEAELIEWASYTNWALILYGRSLHVIFSLDEDDERKIKEITAALNTKQ